MKREIVTLILLVTLQSDIFCNSFDTFYNQARTTHDLIETDPHYTWSIALENYLHAYASCPDRVEPLVMIARYYREQGNLETAFMFARRACEQKVPVDIIDLDFRIYSYDRYEVLSACASSVQEWKLGLWALQEALKVEPNSELLHERLCYYHEQLTLEAGRAIISAAAQEN